MNMTGFKQACLVAACLLGTSVGAEQVPTCKQTFRNGWDGFSNQGEFIAAVRIADPGSNLYVPKPFPKTDAQVLENFRYFYGQIWKDEGSVPDDEIQLYQEYRDHTLHLTIDRVSNWSPHRCNALRPRDFFFVVRAFSASGSELARFAFHPSGMLSRYVTIPATASKEQLENGRFPSTEELSQVARQRLGFHLDGMQRVHLFAQGVNCDVLAPCVVGTNGGERYLIQTAGGLAFYRLDAETEHIPLQEGRGALHSLAPDGDAAMVTVGDEWVVIHRVPEGR